MPGSPRPQRFASMLPSRRGLHPAAQLLSLACAVVGFSVTTSGLALAAGACVAATLALRSEGRSPRAEIPLAALAGIVFVAHALLGAGPLPDAAAAGAVIALRLLALVYLLRWAARAILGRAGRWVLGLVPPRRPRAAVLLFESARLTSTLLPLALREAEQHAVALRARGLTPGHGLAGRARYLATWLLPFLGTMLRVSDAFADALVARGHAVGIRRRSAVEAAWGAREWAVAGLSVLAGGWIAYA